MLKVPVLAGIFIAALATPGAQAGTYPEQPIKLVVGWPPGGATDGNARLLAQALGKRLGQSVIVENRPGAGGSIGGAAVAKATPDGYTLAYISSSNVITSLLLKQPSYGAGRDLEPVSLVAAEPLVLLVGASSPTRTLAEFIDQARRKQQGLNYATTGKGGILHLAGAALVRNAGLTAVDVPYKGTSPAMTALMSGQVDFLFGTFSDALPMIQGGRVKALAIAAESRSPLIPDVPTLTEALGQPDAERGTYQAVLAPKGTPQAIVQRLSADIDTVLNDASIRERLADRGVTPVGGPPQVLGQRIESELDQRGRLIGELGIKAN
ncbi:tripartite tricarboxylate transporter substrate binding protein [Bordetella sp. BOR01]|uniref:Bug family tripartite tricarboxylate transporter substrate binding protein n=1 Tax=Bordetella sp. BOR01 TaxID=2854779 RepID=UPI001C456ED4|nr:tripartite tricarboxylate transporter substrate binding protein [Bordetella sp. BOR01]MBV7483321.1 tripartite tricarboxylate transporter substrate binding protein [Bordetella sp. BOR01]